MAVFVIYAFKLFYPNQTMKSEKFEDFYEQDSEIPMKILITSNTNVAVDRILINLKDLGFEKFVRVGSLKKISKQILPFAITMQQNENDIQELQKMYQDPSLSDQERRLFN